MEKSNNIDWDLLITSIHEGKCILLLGPDIISEEYQGKIMSFNEILTSQLSDSIEYKDINNNLFIIGENFRWEINRNKLVNKIKKFYEGKKTFIIEFYKNLANLPFKLIISTTFDNYIYDSLKSSNKNPSFKYYYYKGPIDTFTESDLKISIDKPLVYNLFGSLENEDSLIISETYLLDFISTIRQQIPSYIDSQLKSEKNIFLFIGFGLKNWYLKILLYLLLSKGKEKDDSHPKSIADHSFAFENYCIDADGNRCTKKNCDNCYKIVFYNKHYAINIFQDIKINDFINILNKKYVELYPEIQSESKINPKSLTIFISYNHNDSDIVNNIKDKIEDKNIEVIIDIESSKYGDDVEEFAKKSVLESNFTIPIISKNSLFSPWVVLEILETLKDENQNKKKKLFPIFIDRSLFNDNFILELGDKIDEVIDKILNLTNIAIKKGMRTTTFDVERDRFADLKNQIDPLIKKLRDKHVTDFTNNEKIDSNLPKLIDTLKDYMKKNGENS